MSLRSFGKRLLQKAGVDLIKYDYRVHPAARRFYLMSSFKIDLVFDVGAHIGNYAKRIRNIGYLGRIVSFEPQSSAYERLSRKAKGDPFWETVNIALGNYNGSVIINIAGNSASSSILEMLSTHVEAEPKSAYVMKEEATIRTIDSIMNDYYNEGERLLLKIDTQGYEKNIIDGAQCSLDRIVGIQLEASLVPLYRGEVLLAEMIQLMSKNGYIPMSLEPVFSHPKTGQLLQVDCMFFPEC